LPLPSSETATYPPAAVTHQTVLPTSSAMSSAPSCRWRRRPAGPPCLKEIGDHFYPLATWMSSAQPRRDLQCDGPSRSLRRRCVSGAGGWRRQLFRCTPVRRKRHEASRGIAVGSRRQNQAHAGGFPAPQRGPGSEACAAYLSRLLPGKPAFLPPLV